MKIKMQVDIDGQTFYAEREGGSPWHVLIRLLYDVHARYQEKKNYVDVRTPTSD